MDNYEIKARIEANAELIEKLFNPFEFTLNTEIKKLLEENKMLQSQCSHEFKDGICIYCYKKEK